MSAVIERLCNLPREYRAGDISINELLKQSGYLARPEIVTRENIKPYLKANASLVPDWIQWSEDQRCHPAWAFGKGEKGYFVYHIPANGVDLTFDSEFDACAEFICRWLSSVNERLS